MIYANEQRSGKANPWKVWTTLKGNYEITLTLQPPPVPTEPFGEVICQYTDTLCTTQKQTNLSNSLLQDIAIFNEYDSTKLEDWLMDIETAADLTSESQAKLSKAKSRGLTCTSVMDAIDSDKSWEELKDLLQLKLCNARIHTYTSHFMDIQQWEKQSLAAYVHRFKTEAKRCNFTNNAATIIIFVKGLKHAHSLATCIYEKGLQMLTDAILEVEKLNAIQQLTAMIIPPSTVNVKSNEECCFQCQEPGHITQNCPPIRCYECDEYGHIVHAEYLLEELQWLTTNLTEVTMPDWVQDITVKIETGEADPDHSLTFEDIADWAIATHTEATLDHNEIDAAITEAAHNVLAQPTGDTVTDLAMTHLTNHIKDLPNIEALLVINPQIIEGHTHDHPMGLQDMNHKFKLIIQQNKVKTISQEEHEGEDRRSTDGLL